MNGVKTRHKSKILIPGCYPRPGLHHVGYVPNVLALGVIQLYLRVSCLCSLVLETIELVLFNYLEKVENRWTKRIATEPEDQDAGSRSSITPIPPSPQARGEGDRTVTH
jgi:hypothetical protein